ncbi:MAG TPA: GyrI-like domain-containing protein [Candidatus Krumholzibacteria bacterium]|jgi:effector-binding domain-containing protein
MPYEVEIITRPVRRVATLAFETEPDDAIFEVESALSSVWSFLVEHNSAPAGNPFSINHHLELDSILPPPAPWRLEVGFPVAEELAGEAPFQVRDLPGGPTARLIHVGDYSGLVEAYMFLQAWLEAGGHEVSGPPRDIYRSDPVAVPDSSQWRTEIQWPIQT